MALVKWRHQQKVDLPSFPRSLRLVNNELWCSMFECIDVYNDQLVLQRCMEKPGLGGIYDVCQLGSTAVAVATSRGLYLLSQSGDTLNLIEAGCYNSVQCHGNCVYATEYDTHSIRVYDICNRLKKLNTFKVPCTDNTPHATTLAVTQDAIMAFCEYAVKLYVMTHSGWLCATHGEYGSGAAGKFRSAYIHQCDDSAVLVADCYNKRIQALDAHGRWSVLDVQPEIEGYPHSVRYHNSHLYLCTTFPNRITNYTCV